MPGTCLARYASPMASVDAYREVVEDAERELARRSPQENRQVARALRALKPGLATSAQRVVDDAATRLRAQSASGSALAELSCELSSQLGQIDDVLLDREELRMRHRPRRAPRMPRHRRGGARHARRSALGSDPVGRPRPAPRQRTRGPRTRAFAHHAPDRQVGRSRGDDVRRIGGSVQAYARPMPRRRPRPVRARTSRAIRRRRRARAARLGARALERVRRRADLEVVRERPVDEALGVHHPQAERQQAGRGDAADEVLDAQHPAIGPQVVVGERAVARQRLLARLAALETSRSSRPSARPK